MQQKVRLTCSCYGRECVHFCMCAFTCTRKLVLVVCLCVIAYLGTSVCALRDAKIWFLSARILISTTGLSSCANAAGTAALTIAAEIGNAFRVYLRACLCDCVCNHSCPF